jgi:uncharacterized repeat protein (TIGR01451 family)
MPSDDYKADLFATKGDEQESAQEVYVPQNYKTQQNQAGDIEIKANKDFENVVGYAFTLEWNPQELSSLGIDTTGTPFHEQGFLTEANNKESGVLKAIAATGGNGINIKKGDAFIRVAMKVSSDVPLGTSIPVRLKEFSIVQESGSLSERVLTTESGKITIENEGDFRVIDAHVISSTSIEVQFSDYISQMAIQDFAFTPELKKDSTTLEIQNTKVVIKNLKEQIAGQEYRLEVAGTAQGNSSGAISSNYNFAFFTGYANTTGISDFYVTDVVAVDENTLDIEFSKDVNPSSIEQVDFNAWNLNIVSVRPTDDPRVLRAITAGQTDLSKKQSCSVDVLVSNDPDLTLQKTADRTVVNTSNMVFFTFSYENKAKGTAKNAKIIDELPEGLEFGVSPSGCELNFETRKITCELGNVVGGQKGQASYSATATQVGIVSGEASISSDGNDLNPNDNSDYEKIRITAEYFADLKVDTTYTEYGDRYKFKTDFKNTGNKISGGGYINITVLNEVLEINNDSNSVDCSYDDAENGSCNCLISKDQKILRCDIKKLESGEEGTLKFEGLKLKSGNASFYSVIRGANTIESDLDNNEQGFMIEVREQDKVKMLFDKFASASVLKKDEEIEIGVQFKNTGNTSIKDINLFDNVPAGLEFVNNSLSTTDCSHDPFSGDISCDFEELNPAESRAISYRVIAKQEGEIRTEAAIQTSGFTGSSELKLKIQDQQQSDLKVFGEGRVVDGSLEYSANFANLGNQAAQNVIMTVKIEPLEIVEIEDADSCKISSNKSEITCNIGTLEAGSSSTKKITANVLSAGSIKIASSIQGRNADFNSANNIFTQYEGVFNSSYVDVKAFVAETVANVGDEINFTIHYVNSGEIPAKNVIVSDIMSAEDILTDFEITSNSDNCLVNENGISCLISNLNPNESRIVEYKARAKKSGVLQNNVQSSDGAKIQRKILITDNKLANLYVQKTADNYIVKPESVITYKTKYKNTGNTTSVKVKLIDQVPFSSDITFVDQNPNCEIKAGLIECNFSTLEPDEEGEIYYTAKINPHTQGGLIHKVAIQSDTEESDLSDNQDSIQISIKDLSCNLQASPMIISKGDDVSLSWQTSAGFAEIDHGIGIVSVPQGSTTVRPFVSTTYTMNTEPKGDNMLVISNESSVWSLKSKDGDILSVNVFPFAPFGAEEIAQTAPRVSRVEATDEGVVINLDRNVFASSATAGKCTTQSGITQGVCDIYSIYQVNDNGIIIGNNLIDENVKAEISKDYKTITLKNITTFPSKKYLLEVRKDTIKDYESEKSVTNFYNKKVFLGKNSFFNESNFAIENIEVKDKTSLVVTFTEEPNDSSVTPLNIKIVSYENGEEKKLTITNTTKQGSKVFIKTYSQQANKSYFLKVDPNEFKNTNGILINSKNSKGFLGYDEKLTIIQSVSPNSFINAEDTEVEITVENLIENSIVKLNSTTLEIIEQTENKIKAVVPETFESGVYTLSVVDPLGNKTDMKNAVAILEKVKHLEVLSDESYASPYKVSNKYGKTRLWVRIQDPLGIDDIAKLTADLRPINGEPGVEFVQGTQGSTPENSSANVVDNKKWFYLDITIPPTISTQSEPTKIDVIAENKSGIKANGTVEFMITKDLTSSIPPEVASAYSYPTQISPGEQTPLTFYVEVTDDDGADDIAKVILDLGQIGLGTKVMRTVDDMYENLDSQAACTAGDYVVGNWSECSNEKRTRSVELKSGVDCDEGSGVRPPNEEACNLRSCTSSDYEAGEWSSCNNSKQTRSYSLKEGVNCQGDYAKPNNDTRNCETSFFMNIFVPTAHASTVVGNSVWFEEKGLLVPSNVKPGTYELPVIVIDKSGEETRSKISVKIQKNAGGVPTIDKDDIYAVPRNGVANDGVSTFTLNIKVKDPNGPEDIESVSANLMELGMPPISLNRTVEEGGGVWFSSEPLTVDRAITPGHREIEFTVTDKQGNYYSYDNFKFHVSDGALAGDKPIIYTDKNYMSPKSIPNDGETRSTLYIFVEEGDAEIESVIVNLGNIAHKVKGTNNEKSSSLNIFAPKDSEKPSSTETADKDLEKQNEAAPSLEQKIITLTPSVKEGAKGRWYFATDIVAEKTTAPSSEPYLFPITATDVNGNSSEENFEFYVTDGFVSKDRSPLPYIKNTRATSERNVEILFSKPLDTSKIKSNVFKVVDYENISERLPIRKIKVSADGRIVNLETNFMQEDTRYTLIVDSEALGIKDVQGTNNQINFETFDEEEFKGDATIKNVSPISENEIKIEFSHPIKYSSLDESGKNFQIIQQDKKKALKVKSAIIGKEDISIILYTEGQVPNRDYYVFQRDLEVIGGAKLKTRSKSFKGYNPPVDEAGLFAQSDFNGDNKIDFLDFTLFSSVYGKTADDEIDVMDLNKDGKIDFTDFTIFAQTFNQQGQDKEKETEFTPYDTKKINTNIFDYQ